MDLARPRLHHTAPTGWINDPQLVWHDGQYHLFFQHVPGRTTWDVGCHWGHATSTDLLTWEPQPIALAPGDGDGGCWSGSVAGGVLFYTSVDADRPERGRVRRAVPDASWTTWTKQDVVVEPPPEATHFRDPFVRRTDDGWQMILGCATAAGPAVWSYRSDDLEHWAAEGVVASVLSGPEVGQGWECPVLLDVDGRTVLVVSVWEPDRLHHLAYAVCAPDGDGLHPGTFHRLSHGPSLYAASGFTDVDGRPGLVAWLREVADVEAGWAGATSLPCTVELVEGRLVLTPPAGTTELELPGAGGPLRLVADGPVLEVFGDHGWAAVPLEVSVRP